MDQKNLQEIINRLRVVEAQAAFLLNESQEIRLLLSAGDSLTEKGKKNIDPELVANLVAGRIRNLTQKKYG